MVSVRCGIGLALSAFVVAAAAAAPANAAVICTGTPLHVGLEGCDEVRQGLQETLDAAAERAGTDTVRIYGYSHDVPTGLVYSDRGQAGNAVVIEEGRDCYRYGCTPVTLEGGPPGGSMLSFAGGGGATVTVAELGFRPDSGVTALALPAGAEARGVWVDGRNGSMGIRASGTPERPVVIRSGLIGAVFGGAQDIAIDATGTTVVEDVSLGADIAARSRGGGSLDIRGGEISGRTAVTGVDARLTGVLVNLRNVAGPAVGLEAACEGAGAADAELTATNVTLVGDGTPESTGLRAVARGGDGESCDAVARINSTILHGVGTALDAAGEAGSGAAPQDGVARVEAAYSNFSAASVQQSGPSEIETASPGRNLDADPGFNPRVIFPEHALGWDSPLVDRGDPAEPEQWQRRWIRVRRGRRDIGADEYDFFRPSLYPRTDSYSTVRRGTTVRLSSGAFDQDYEPLQVRWMLSDGTESAYEMTNTIEEPALHRRYPRVGTYVERVSAVDPTGLSASAKLVIRVVRQRMKLLALSRERFRAGPRQGDNRGAEIYLRTAAPDTVHFRVERGVRGKRGLRWVRTRLRFRLFTSPADDIPHRFNGWVGRHRLRPGRYRLVAAPVGVRPLRARFQIIR
jgi:hypothetical protein